MTAPARIRQSDIERAIKAVKAAGIETARIVIDLRAQTIAVCIGKSEDSMSLANEWDSELE